MQRHRLAFVALLVVSAGLAACGGKIQHVDLTPPTSQQIVDRAMAKQELRTEEVWNDSGKDAYVYICWRVTPLGETEDHVIWAQWMISGLRMSIPMIRDSWLLKGYFLSRRTDPEGAVGSVNHIPLLVVPNDPSGWIITMRPDALPRAR